MDNESGKKQKTADGAAQDGAKGGQAWSGTIYDDAFRKMAEHHPELFIPLINEVFHCNYPRDIAIRQLRNEYYELEGKIITDVALEVDGRVFHFECQSNPDGTMLVRMMEYTFAIAVDRIRGSKLRMDGSDVVQLPNAAVVYLRQTRNTPDEFVVNLRNAKGDSIPLEFRVIKVQEYTRDALFAKDLLLFLPYYAMRYESEWEKMEADGALRQRFLDDCQEALLALWHQKGKTVSAAAAEDLTNAMREILQHLLRKHKDIQKEAKQMLEVSRLGPLPSEIREEYESKLAEQKAASEARLAADDALIAALKAQLLAAGIQPAA